ncbi:unnamed protein product, partial [Polarella glacialis]
ALIHGSVAEEWKSPFHRQRLVDGVAQCDLDFADRVLDACLNEPAFIEALIAEATASKTDPPAVTEMDIACHTGGRRGLHGVAKAAFSRMSSWR